MNVLLAFVIFTGDRLARVASDRASSSHEVQPDSPAAAAGLQPGDTIVAINGERFQFRQRPMRIDCSGTTLGRPSI